MLRLCSSCLSLRLVCYVVLGIINFVAYRNTVFLCSSLRVYMENYVFILRTVKKGLTSAYINISLQLEFGIRSILGKLNKQFCQVLFPK
jgi:hypothetical protein